MAFGSQQISRFPGVWPGVVVGVLLAALGLGTLVVVALNASGAAALGPSDWATLRFTLWQAGLSAILSVGLAVPVARALTRRRFRGRALLVSLLGAPFLLPVIVAVLGLLAVYGRNGLVSSVVAWLGWPPLNIYGLGGIVLAHVFFNLPLATRLLLQGWQSIPAEHFRLAAQLGLTTRDINRHLERPMLFAVVPGALATIFLLCVTSFAVVLTLGGGPRATTLELAIYQAFRFDFNLGKAALLAVLQFAISAAAAALAWKLAGPTRFGAGMARPVMRWDCRNRFSRIRDGILLLAISVFLFTPLVMILLRGLAGLGALPLAVLAPAALRSLIVALGSAGLTLGMSLVLSLTITRLSTQRRGLAGLLEATGYLSIAASPMVMGTGIFIVLFPIIDPATVALAITALVNALMSIPFALRTLSPAINDAQTGYGRLADSLGMTRGVRFRLVIWPRIRPAAGFATGLAAALSMGDLGVIALFADPQSATLPLVLYRLMGSYQMAAANGAALVLVLASFGLFAAFDIWAKRDA